MTFFVNVGPRLSSYIPDSNVNFETYLKEPSKENFVLIDDLLYSKRGGRLRLCLPISLLDIVINSPAVVWHEFRRGGVVHNWNC